MRRFIPHLHELALFALLAIVFSTIVHVFVPQGTDLSLAAFGAPMFLVAAVLGLRRSPLWTGAQVAEDADSDNEGDLA